MSVEGRREVLGLWPAADGEQWPQVLAGRGVREVWVLVGGTGAVLAEAAALERLALAEREWGPSHREVFRVWRSAWPLLAPGFRFGPEARRLLTGGGALERLHARLRRIEQAAGRVQDERAALKRAYLATLALESAPGAARPWVEDWPAVREELRRGSVRRAGMPASALRCPPRHRSSHH